jgi:chromosome segregation ATPase
MTHRVHPVFLLALLLSGCSVNSPEELDRLTKEDPVFKQMILQRDQVHAQAQLIKEDLLNRKKAMDAQIDKLRQEYDAMAKSQNLKIEKYQTLIDSNRAKLKADIERAVEQLSEKSVKVEGYKRTLQDIQKVLKEGKGTNFTAADKRKWEEQILILSEKIRPLEEEIQDLKLQIRLKKQKIGFLN